MGFILILAFSLLLYRCRITIKGFFADYLDKNKTNAIKGFFLILVFMTHFYQYIGLKGGIHTPYIIFRRFTGQLIVVPFLFYSGYGVMESLKEKGLHYLRCMPIKRVLHTLVNFDIAVMIFLVLLLLQGRVLPLKQILLSFTGFDSIGNSNWYIFAILYLYTITYLSFISFYDENKFNFRFNPSFICIAILCFVFIYYMSRVRRAYYYDTIFAYCAGLFYAYHKPIIEEIIFTKKSFIFITLLSLILFFMLHSNWNKHIIIYESVAILFAFLVVAFTMKFEIGNPFLEYCGRHLFSLYILQRLPMQYLRATVFGTRRPYIYFVSCLLLTFVISYIFDYIIAIFWKSLSIKTRS